MSALDFGLLLLGLVVGLTLAAHGAQKGLGWFGGPGMPGWTRTVAGMGFAPAVPLAWVAMLAELLGGLGLALGVLTPVAAAVILAQMVVVIVHVHLRNGFWNTNRGIEYPLVLATVAVVLGLVGRGGVSVDSLLLSRGVSITALAVMPPIAARIALLVAGAAAGALATTVGTTTPSEAPRTPRQESDRTAGTGRIPR